METVQLDGELFLRMLAGGAKNLRANKQTIDDLNVFPVPDGDTGSNMTRTFETGLEEAKKVQSKKISDIANNLSHGMLLGARGNSGVILSQIFKGIQLELQKYDDVNVMQLLSAYESGVQQSYRAVVTPVEGTILTVFREATEYTKKTIKAESTIEDFYKAHVLGARIALPKTKEILQALKDADVIDSGGAGYLCIAEGMFNALINPNYNPSGSEVETFDVQEENSYSDIDISAFTRDSELEFGYCTECLLRLQTKKVDVDNFDINIIINYLNEMGGESVVAFKEGDIVKLHVHTPNPGNVLNELRKYGEFLTVKVENMALQHEEIVKSKKTSAKKTEHKILAVVAVANGDGIKQIFTDFGADIIVDGGQTGNPPASAFIEAFKQLNADKIIVLPNNSNIILTAQQAANLYTEADIHVIPTKSVQQCFTALALINPTMPDIQAMIRDVETSVQDVVSGDVAVAIRDAELCGKTIKKGNYLGMFGDTVVTVKDDKLSALMEMISKVEDIDDRELFTLFYGKDVVKEEVEKAEQMISELYPDLEITVYNGGQDVYSFLIAIE